MRALRRLHQHKVATSESKVFLLAFMSLFFVIFDGIIMYLSPIVMQKANISLGTIGLILGFSSVAGVFFDVILLRLLEKANYKRIFFFMFIVAITVPFLLFGGTTVLIYLAAMAAWGLYYNLFDIASMDFIGRTTASNVHESSFGILNAFEQFGYLVAPFVGSLMLVTIGSKNILPGWIFAFLVVAFIFYVLLCFRKLSVNNKEKPEHKKVLSIFTEVELWEKIGKVIFPVLILCLVINLVDASVWTIGPLFSESISISSSGLTGGAFMLAYTLPPLLVGWFVGRLALKFGKKNIALVSLFLGSLLLVLVGFVEIKLLAIALIFCVSFFWAMVWPTMNAAYADKVMATPQYGEEIETIDDWSMNLGDMSGPILGGYAAQFFGITHSFIITGVFGLIAAVILFCFIPKNLVEPIRK